ncbi:hypothetical protein G5714_004374 [Onychostoma macrolepis]|uniref:Ribonuclease A-domain domain-containing protein n=1 Tax=Onychostoma macrolepis TaxID=369639 RepID=A0A7J6D4J9_9TELE|nr:hypothetical protein G5714_004374 [Onychostoma macrolepis]
MEMLANEEESEISEEVQGDIRPSEEEEEMKREMIQPSGKRRTKYSFTQNKKVMEIHRSTVILLLLSSVSSFTHGQSAYIRARYQKFLNQHQGPYVNEEMCTDVIRDRNITDSAGDCKLVNTFIQANENDIKAVCRGGTRVKYNLFRSGEPFNVVTCRLNPNTSGQRHPNCEYRGDLYTHHNIELACAHNLPVHYQG